jgi:hypothetical protein
MAGQQARIQTSSILAAVADVTGSGAIALGHLLWGYSGFKRRFGRFKPAIEADIIPSLLIHLGIWTAVAAALGVAFGFGS